MESVKKYFKSEFEVHMFLLDYQDPAEFALSCWQKNRQTLPLLLWRSFLFASSLSIALGSMITYMTNSIFRYWLIYLTHWGLLSIVLMTGFATAISARCYFRGPIDSGLGLPWYVKVYWVLYNIAVPLALLITIFYWTLLYDAGVEEEVNPLLDVAVHGLNSLIALMKLMSCRHSSRILHFHHPLMAAVVYMVFGVIYYAAGGTDQKGNHWIYPVLNWAKPGSTTLLVLMTGLLLLVLHMLTVSLATLRNATAKRLLADKAPTHEAVPLRQDSAPHSGDPRVSV